MPVVYQVVIAGYRKVVAIRARHSSSKNAAGFPWFWLGCRQLFFYQAVKYGLPVNRPASP
jgi:hypothetical protein